jgi:2-polyprenyl-6-hydroxyphenyl methylase/3-demethylubiquinone-9 3-methyltransferase
MAETTTNSPPSNDPFVDYYVRESVSPRTVERFRGTMRGVLRVRAAVGLPVASLEVADVGCNTGTQSLLWADEGHRVRGLDINEGLLEVARTRSRQAGKDIDFALGSATELPWPSSSVDVCLLPELLEHVADWEGCLEEACRVVRPGGTLYLSTTNALCPVQNEFDMPCYSWFPAPLKRHYEKLSVTTRPELVNHAKYPAVHWFTPYGLGKYLHERGFETFDRFDAMDTTGFGVVARALVGATRIPPLRWLAHVATPYTMLIANKRA